MEVRASKSSNTTFSKGTYAFESPKCSKELCLQELTILHFKGNLCLQALAEPTPLQATLPTIGSTRANLAGQILGPPTPIALSLMEYVEDFSWNFLWALFMEIKRMSMSENYDQTFDAFSTVSAKAFAKISLSVIMFIKNCGKAQALVAFCAYALSHTPTNTHTHTKEKRKEGKPVTVTNSEIQIRTNSAGIR